MMEDSRGVYQEMLGDREFLEHGVPMSFDVPAARIPAVVWSGLRLPDRCLIRTFTLTRFRSR